MSEEITINKNNKSISFIHNNIAFSQFGVADEILDLITDLQTQLQQKENIIKEVREYIEKVETLAMVDKVNIFSLSSLKMILDRENK